MKYSFLTFVSELFCKNSHVDVPWTDTRASNESGILEGGARKPAGETPSLRVPGWDRGQWVLTPFLPDSLWDPHINNDKKHGLECE